MTVRDDSEAAALALYQALRAGGTAASTADLLRSAGLAAEQAGPAWGRLRELGLVRFEDGVPEPVDPDTALAGTLDAYHATAAEQARSAAGLQQRTTTLLTVYRPAVAREASQVEVEYFRTRGDKDRTLRSLDSSVRHTIDTLHPGPLPAPDVLDASARKDERLRRKGIRMRTIYPRSALHASPYHRHLRELAELGIELGLIDHAPYDLLVYDAEVACLPADPHAHTASPMIVIRGSALIRTQVAMFEDYWLRALPYEQAFPVGPAAAPSADTGLAPQEEVVIRLMAGGLSDDQIARRMGVSRRTVQRAVTKLMERLGASSRFEAGLKLARDPDFARALRR